MSTCPVKHPDGYSCSREAGHVGNHRPVAKHTCHWPGCEQEVPPALWGCKSHWYKLPAALRSRIWATYVPGQEITKTPSEEYMEAAEAVQQWIKVQEPSGGEK